MSLIAEAILLTFFLIVSAIQFFLIYVYIPLLFLRKEGDFITPSKAPFTEIIGSVMRDEHHEI